MIIIGSVSKAQGVKGEIKVNPMTDNIERFETLERVTIAGKEYNVEYAKLLCNGVFLKLEGVDDRNTAELLHGKKLAVRREDAVELDEGEYFIVDVMGSSVSLDGEPIGKLVDIMQYGAADVYVVSTPDKKKVMFPLLKDAINKIDTTNKTIDLKKKRFEEIAVYED